MYDGIALQQSIFRMKFFIFQNLLDPAGRGVKKAVCNILVLLARSVPAEDYIQKFATNSINTHHEPDMGCPQPSPFLQLCVSLAPSQTEGVLYSADNKDQSRLLHS